MVRVDLSVRDCAICWVLSVGRFQPLPTDLGLVAEQDRMERSSVNLRLFICAPGDQEVLSKRLDGAAQLSHLRG